MTYFCAILLHKYMQKIFITILLLLLPGIFFQFGNPTAKEHHISRTTETARAQLCNELYHCMNLDSLVNKKAFEQAVEGYYKIGKRKKDILTLIDFSKPSTKQRLFVFDMKARKVLFTSVVSHGKNSGENYATSFSNENGSHKSSLGFYLTEQTYQGKNGYSLILNGLEKGINDKAKERAIVMHGAAYSNPSVIQSAGRLGRSFGCPAIPQKLSRPIIDTIKDGSVLYIYAPKPEYLAQSSILQDQEHV